MSNLWYRSVYHDLKKDRSTFFYSLFFAYFLSTFSLKNMRLGEWYKKGHPVFASLWGESIKCWQCCKMQWEMEKQVSSTRCRGQQQQQKEKEGGGEVKAGVATRWLIPSSISLRSNCWTLLNMTYLWSASCGTKGEAKLQLGNAQWNGRKSAAIILPFSSFSVCLLFSIFFLGFNCTRARDRGSWPLPLPLNGKRIYISYLWSSFDCLRLTWATSHWITGQLLGNRNFSLAT